MKCPFEITDEDRKKARAEGIAYQRHRRDNEVFYCLCFTINSPQTTFVSNQKVMAQLWARDFYNRGIPREELIPIVRPVRFKRKADYLLEARKNFRSILTLLQADYSADYKRDWLVKNVKGLGMKTASMLLRDLGEPNLAVIDVHILKFLQRPIPSNKKQYLELERIFREESRVVDMTAAEFDTFLWMKYSGTPW